MKNLAGGGQEAELIRDMELALIEARDFGEEMIHRQASGDLEELRSGLQSGGAKLGGTLAAADAYAGSMYQKMEGEKAQASKRRPKGRVRFPGARRVGFALCVGILDGTYPEHRCPLGILAMQAEQTPKTLAVSRKSYYNTVNTSI